MLNLNDSLLLVLSCPHLQSVDTDQEVENTECCQLYYVAEGKHSQCDQCTNACISHPKLNLLFCFGNQSCYNVQTQETCGQHNIHD